MVFRPLFRQNLKDAAEDPLDELQHGDFDSGHVN
jgi:hypothetical protein